VFDPAKFTQLQQSHLNSGLQVYYYATYYDGDGGTNKGGFSSKIKANTIFQSSGRPACHAISLTQDQDSNPIGVYTTSLFVLKDDVGAANAKSEKERIERIERIEQNLKKVTGKKDVGAEVYFYETPDDEVKRQNPKRGIIKKINGFFGMSKSYDLAYESGKIINVKSIYEPGQQQGGNKNKTRCCRRRKHPRKSIKKKQSSRKGRKRHSIKEKFRRSRSRK
jgi:hypothetical protein